MVLSRLGRSRWRLPSSGSVQTRVLSPEDHRRQHGALLGEAPQERAIPATDQRIVEALIQHPLHPARLQEEIHTDHRHPRLRKVGEGRAHVGTPEDHGVGFF